MKKICSVLLILLLLGFVFVLSLYKNVGVFDLATVPCEDLIFLVERQYCGKEEMFVLPNLESQQIFVQMRDGKTLTSCSSSWNHGEKGEHVTVQGWFYAIPRWMDNPLVRSLAVCLRHGIYVKYDPFNEMLYLSDDCEKLAWDYMYGFTISNIPPSSLRVDVGRLKSLRCKNRTDDWKYRGETLMKSESSSHAP